MKYIKLILIILLVGNIFFFSCEDWVQGLPAREDIIEDKVLIDTTDVTFLVNGIKANFSSTVERSVYFGDLLGDQLIYGKDIAKDATFSSFDEIEKGEILLNNNSVDGLADNLGELWFLSDDLIQRINNRMEPMSDNLKNFGLYNAYLYNGIACEIYAGFFGLEKDQGGGVLNSGPFIPSEAMYDTALAKFDKALDFATTSEEERLVHSLMARCNLYQGDYDNAFAHAQQGLQDGDADLKALYSNIADNYLWQQASSALRSQVIVDNRFADYLAEDSSEAARVMIEVLPEDLNVTQGADTAKTFYLQTKYYSSSAPIPYITWQENNLMLAELAALHGKSGDPVALINAVRTSHGIPTLASVDEDVIIEERDKELFLTGQRLIDQRRFDLWHLPADTWHYLPIVERERNSNDNID
ncbi:MAG TPA: hypothetical protein VKP78_08945 [bacterium]|nr:hypothetical protein [bacterium]